MLYFRSMLSCFCRVLSGDGAADAGPANVSPAEPSSTAASLRQQEKGCQGPGGKYCAQVSTSCLVGKVWFCQLFSSAHTSGVLKCRKPMACPLEMLYKATIKIVGDQLRTTAQGWGCSWAVVFIELNKVICILQRVWGFSTSSWLCWVLLFVCLWGKYCSQLQPKFVQLPLSSSSQKCNHLWGKGPRRGTYRVLILLCWFLIGKIVAFSLPCVLENELCVLPPARLLCSCASSVHTPVTARCW